MIESKVKEAITDIITSNGYILDDVLYVKEGSSYFLRIVVDKNGAYVNVDDCVKINSLIGPVLDELDIIKESYILDICSKEKGSI